MLALIDIFHGFQISIVAYTIAVAMTKQGMILERYLDLLLWLDNKDMKPLAMAMGLCEKCFAGQIALWYWIIQNRHLRGQEALDSISQMVVFICTAIFGVLIIQKVLTK